MKNQRFACSRVLALILPVTLGLGCGLKRDWRYCSSNDPCKPGYICTAEWTCVLPGDGGSDGLVAVDGRGATDAVGGGMDGTVSAGGDGPWGTGQDAGEAEHAPASPLTDATVGLVPALDGRADQVPVDASPDVPVATVPDAPAVGGTPDAPPAAAPPDAPPADIVPDSPAANSPPDAPSLEAPTGGPTPDAAGTCSTDKDCAGGPAGFCDTSTKRCVACLKRSDCAGVCQACSNGVCTAVKNQDDPTACAGTCDSSGACKSKQGQTCQTATDCAGGLPCADSYCCNRSCSGSCEACDVGISLGTCTTLGLNATPHVNHAACIASDAACAGKCDGKSAACAYPSSTTSCGTASCSGTTYQPVGSCNAGACSMPVTQPCPTNQTCSGNACACQSPNLTCSGTCVDAQSDPKNCGACGHDCLGGTCSGGLCQPKLLADVSLSWEGASTFMISGTNLILNLGGRGMPADAYNVWAVDINGAGAVGLRGIVSNASRAVALDGRLYWITTSGSSAQLISCPQANCTAANFVTVATRDGGSGNSIAAPLLVADPSTHELVWQEYVYSNSVYTLSVVRSGPQGPARALTSFASTTFLNWSTSNNRPDRFFWYTLDSSYTQATVYYLPTNTASASAVAITGPMTVSVSNILANDTTAYLNAGISSPYQVLAIPLPNGVVGTPSSVYAGSWTVVDAQYAYGQYNGTAYDGVWRCSLTNCSPTYLARGFLSSGTYFLLDDTAIYLLDRPSGGASFKVWKLAK